MAMMPPKAETGSQSQRLCQRRLRRSLGRCRHAARIGVFDDGASGAFARRQIHCHQLERRIGIIDVVVRQRLALNLCRAVATPRRVGPRGVPPT